MLLYNIRVAGKEGSKLESEMDGPGSPPEYPGNDAHPGSPVPLMSFVDLNSVKGLTRVHYNQAFSNFNNNLTLPLKKPKLENQPKIVSKDSALSLEFITSSSSGGSGFNALDESDSLSTQLNKRCLATVTVTSSSESDVEFVEERKVKPSERLHASNLPFQLDLQVVCLIGTGGYGKVFLVKSKVDLSKHELLTQDSQQSVVSLSPDHGKKRASRGRPRKIQFIRNTGKGAQTPSQSCQDGFHYYAMKTVKKIAVCKSKADMEHIRTEQRILSRVKHHFIVDCHLTLQTRKQLLFVSEFIQGGELFNLLDKFAPLAEKDARFYMCEILVALDYLHSQRIIYRDLKPENVMLCKDGHLKLIDFGLCRDNFPASPIGGRVSTATKCGTKEYMAPEVYKREQYGFTADWWSYGAVAFDLMTNNVPVSNQEYEKEVKYPENMSKNAVNLISRLLDVDKRKRLGSQLGARCISDHEFFQGIDWEMVKTKGLRPPYILSGNPLPGDHSCFSNKVTKEACRVCSESDSNDKLPDFNNDPFSNFDFIVGNQLDLM